MFVVSLVCKMHRFGMDVGLINVSLFCCLKVHLTEREKQKLQVWARVMPFREPFAWATVALFDANVTGGVGGFSSSPTSSPLPPGILGSALMEASLDSDGRLIADSKTESASVPVLVDVPGLHRVKENYTDEMLQVGFKFSLYQAPGGKSSRSYVMSVTHVFFLLEKGHQQSKRVCLITALKIKHPGGPDF